MFFLALQHFCFKLDFSVFYILPSAIFISYFLTKTHHVLWKHFLWSNRCVGLGFEKLYKVKLFFHIYKKDISVIGLLFTKSLTSHPSMKHHWGMAHIHWHLANRSMRFKIHICGWNNYSLDYFLENHMYFALP